MAALSRRSSVIDEVYITGELYRRTSKAPDFEREKIALQSLAHQIIDRPAEVLSRLVDLAIEFCGGISGGISLWEPDPAPGVFRWHHLRGTLEQFTGGTTPRDFSPCGVTLDQNGAVLARRPERVYTWLADAKISVAEVLLVPLFVGGSEPIGTLWIVSENEGHFDSGHVRVMNELAMFGGIAVHMVRTEERAKAALADQETLTREMSHRVKNLFSIVGGLIRASARSSETPKEMSEILVGRVDALAAANALVRRKFDDEATTEHAELAEVVRKILQPHVRPGEESCFDIEGPSIRLGERSINGIALILHEFATNAAKYGALKNEHGSVSVKWRQTEIGLILEWEERGGPAIDAAPKTTGFGTRLSQTTVRGQFNGTLIYDWDTAGLKVSMTLSANLSQ